MEGGRTQEKNYLDKGTGRSGASARIFQCSILKTWLIQPRSRGGQLDEPINGDSISNRLGLFFSGYKAR